MLCTSCSAQNGADVHTETPMVPTWQPLAMEHFEGRIAVVTGGGSGMGRELARQLSAEGCHVSTCDVAEESLAETKALCEANAPAGTRIATFVADVADESALQAFASAV